MSSIRARAFTQPREQAELSLLIILSMLCRRVTPEEARHLIAQLPSKLHPELERNLDGPDRRVTTAAIAAELMSRLDVGEDVAAVPRSSATAVADVWLNSSCKSQARCLCPSRRVRPRR
ncbi:MAG: DUF2267 domain-containing protein [Byssovorax sp.]